MISTSAGPARRLLLARMTPSRRASSHALTFSQVRSACACGSTPLCRTPLTPADLDLFVPDFRWNEIRISSGGSNSFAFWDDMRIEKGAPSTSIGTNYCGPATAHSGGLFAEITASGSAVAADNNVTLVASSMPGGQFGFFLNSITPAFVPNPRR